MRLGGQLWLKNMKQRHLVMRDITTKRPVELKNAMKIQPEYSVTEFRMIHFIQALAQMQRRIGEGFLVEDWGVVGGLIQRNIGTGPLECMHKFCLKNNIKFDCFVNKFTILNIVDSLLQALQNGEMMC